MSPVGPVPPGVHSVADADFADLVLGAAGPVLVAFHAGTVDRCADLDAIDAAVPWLACRRLDVDRSPRTAATYRVSRVPTLVVFERGEPVLTMFGPQPLDVLLRMVRALRPEPTPA
jgi:thioredoxin 1